jgi:hypothetical protein
MQVERELSGGYTSLSRHLQLSIIRELERLRFRYLTRNTLVIFVRTLAVRLQS